MRGRARLRTCVPRAWADTALHCLQLPQHLSWAPTAQNFLKLKHLVGVRGALPSQRW